MARLVKTEVCLEINEETESQLLELDQRYLDGKLSKSIMAAQASLVIMDFLMDNDLILVKVFSGLPIRKEKQNDKGTNAEEDNDDAK